MKKQEQRIPVYYVMGFLESGKSSFLIHTMNQDYFQIKEPTLLIACEEGEIEYGQEMLRANNTHLEMLEEPEELTGERLQELHEKYQPVRVMIEFNSFWDAKGLSVQKMPEGWEVIQQIVTVDGSTFDTYMNNMKSIFMEMVREADMIIFNRCSEAQPLANYRRSIKVVNPGADIIFENQTGELIDIFDGGVPYNLDADTIEIEDTDYGIFYVDMRDNPERYTGKKVKFRGRVLKSRKPGASYFVPSRMAMTCCADDTSHIGYICKSAETKNLAMGEWIEVTADVRWEWFSEYRGKGPVLYAKSIEKSQPPQVELVYFT